MWSRSLWKGRERHRSFPMQSRLALKDTLPPSPNIIHFSLIVTQIQAPRKKAEAPTRALSWQVPGICGMTLRPPLGWPAGKAQAAGLDVWTVPQHLWSLAEQKADTWETWGRCEVFTHSRLAHLQGQEPGRPLGTLLRGHKDPGAGCGECLVPRHLQVSGLLDRETHSFEKWARRIRHGETGYSQKGSMAITSRVPAFKTIRTPFQLEGRSTYQL